VESGPKRGRIRRLEKKEKKCGIMREDHEGRQGRAFVM
jgi:hypothetical protein